MTKNHGHQIAAGFFGGRKISKYGLERIKDKIKVYRESGIPPRQSITDEEIDYIISECESASIVAVGIDLITQDIFDIAQQFKDREDQKIEVQHMAQCLYDIGREVGMETAGEMLDREFQEHKE